MVFRTLFLVDTLPMFCYTERSLNISEFCYAKLPSSAAFSSHSQQNGCNATLLCGFLLVGCLGKAPRSYTNQIYKKIGRLSLPIFYIYKFYFASIILFFLFFAFNVIYNSAFVHHYKSVSYLYGVFHIMSNHKSC